MKTRKVISAILAGACAISALAIPATAAGPTTAPQSESIAAIKEITYSATGGLISPTLNVVLPTNDAIVAYLNPYGLGEKDGQKISGGIASPTYKVRNLGGESGVKLTVTTAKITGSDGVTVVTDGTGLEADTTKKVYAYLSARATKTGATTKLSAENNVKYDKSYKYEVEGDVTWSDEAKVNFTETGTIAGGQVIMQLTKATGTTSSKGVFTPTAYSYGEFKVTGAVSSGNPDNWSTDDTVTLDVIYKVTPWNE